MFHAEFGKRGRVALKMVNDWNGENFSKAYLRNDKFLFLKYAVNLEGGVARGPLREAIIRWQNELWWFFQDAIVNKK